MDRAETTIASAHKGILPKEAISKATKSLSASGCKEDVVNEGAANQGVENCDDADVTTVSSRMLRWRQ